MELLRVDRIGTARANTRPVETITVLHACLCYALRPDGHPNAMHRTVHFVCILLLCDMRKTMPKVVTTNGGSYGSCGMRGPLL